VEEAPPLTREAPPLDEELLQPTELAPQAAEEDLLGSEEVVAGDASHLSARPRTP